MTEASSLPETEDSYGAAEPLRVALWRLQSAGVAVQALAKHCGLQPRIAAVPPTVPTSVQIDERAFDRWIEGMAEHLHIEADAVSAQYAELDAMLASLAPAIVRVSTPRGERLIAVVASNKRKFVLLGMGGELVEAPTSLIRHLLVQQLEALVSPEIDVMLERAQVPLRKRRISRARLLRQRVGAIRIDCAWILRASPGAPVALQARLAGTNVRVALYLALMFAQMGIGIGAWYLMGSRSLDGRVDLATLQGWALLALTNAPITALQAWLGGRIGVDISSIMKRRLLLGALKLSPDKIRSEGSGQLLAMIGESQVVESAGFSSALSAISAVISLATAGAILGAGVGGAVHVALLCVWGVLVGATSYLFARRADAWTQMRMRMTNHLVERMVGHRTRAVQERAKNRHAAEDDELERYLATSRAMDWTAVVVEAIPSRGWLVVGFLGMIPGLVMNKTSVASVLVSIGGIFAAQSAFGVIVASVNGFVGLSVAWRSIRPLFDAASVQDATGSPNVVAAIAPQEQGDVAALEDDSTAEHDGRHDAVLDVRNVSFRYRSGGEPVLRNVSLVLRQGDRVLLEGGSGGGKSTFASVLAGLQTPEAGLVLLRGLDRGALGASGWRRRVASAPQFHENHMVTGTLAFNLLLGRRWPADPSDLEEAREVCEALGLGPLLAKMPSGLEQMLGETGWQLSHGERSRIFLARALLQQADVVLLDESFGALDPLTLKTCMEATIDRAKTLVVIAHP